MFSHRHAPRCLLAVPALIGLLLLVGCNEEPPERLDATNFDQSCQTARDCRLVDERTCQECSGAGTAAINKDAVEAFQQAQDDIDCDERSTEGCNNASALPRPYAVCQDNTCDIWPADDPEGLADQVSRSCSQDSDCVPIRSSEPDHCTYDTCECPDLAVNRQARNELLVAECDAQTPYADCNETPSCSGAIEAVCDAGRCVLGP